MRIQDLMTPNPIVADPTMSIGEATKLMKDKRIRRLPVMERGRLIGIVTDRDLKEVSPSSAVSLSGNIQRDTPASQREEGGG